LRLIRILVVLVVSVICLIPAAYAAPVIPVEPMQVGDQSDEVLAVQEKLSQMGYVAGSMDGVFGNATASAVKMLQQEKKLPEDGMVSPELFKMLIGRDLPVSRGAPVATVRRLLQSSFQHLGVPYWFGGTTPRGFDCSGFTRYVFANIGIMLPRMADEQFAIGRPVPAERLQAGDLVFFETYEAGASHVGIYVGNAQFISATSSRGIAVADLFSGYWGERYIGARRVL